MNPVESTLPPLDFATLRDQIVGADATFETPFGNRLMVYCDYTASGRCLGFVERYLLELQRIYANTHTEDDVTGRSMTRLLHRAEQEIKRSVNAGPRGQLIACGAGSTAAIDKLQQILGVALPPATRDRVLRSMDERAQAHLQDTAPVVFIGPYEHHSNEITWRQNLAQVVPIPLDAEGGIDLAVLESQLRDPRWQGRMKIGSFSAASNVTGMLSPVHALAELLHRHDALACFDYAACAPYVSIDMNPAGRPEAALDAVFISPHKFLGGPGSSGVLVFNEALYDSELGPTVAGGGTVDYVGTVSHDFVCNIEEREKAGTPGVLQTLKAALAFMIKDRLGTESIEAREQELLGRAFSIWQAEPAIEILGNPDPARRVAIVSFNLRDPWGGYLHPKLVTVLLNDLFGIQSRAGCSCAGPYGHHLLGISDETSQRYRRWVKAGYYGVKPGWCRIGFHFAMDDVEADFIIQAVRFIAREGWRFLHVYHFDLKRACWSHERESSCLDAFSLDAALASTGARCQSLAPALRADLYARYLHDAENLARELESRGEPERHVEADAELQELIFFRK
ncbi:MAG: aminotransferase class V-fold PLP-dependent enzyme [Calditrichaeota bacterium]|nr:aminotransferase class V-fold PLP-dependent enzyme [Calditrichota bacterium]